MTLALLGSSTKDVFKVKKDPHGREPFQHPATEGIEVLNGGARAHLLHHKQISTLSQQYGLHNVVRWNPRKVGLFSFQTLQDFGLTVLQPESLQASGFDMVLTQAVFAIVGAIALERGGGEANQIVRERIIGPLGLRAKVLEGPTASQFQ
jgi:large subunit ribosomal protein L15